jgi:hypothetical protein
MSTHDLARRVAILHALSAKVDDALTEARRQLAEGMETGDRVTIKTGDDVLGSATLAKGATSARISDGEKLLAWVAERYPEQIITERRIRSAVTARIIAQSKAAGQPVYDGELDVPGITVSVGEPKLQLRAEDDAAVVIERLWQAGEIDLRVLLALPGGE